MELFYSNINDQVRCFQTTEYFCVLCHRTSFLSFANRSTDNYIYIANCIWHDSLYWNKIHNKIIRSISKRVPLNILGWIFKHWLIIYIHVFLFWCHGVPEKQTMHDMYESLVHHLAYIGPGLLLQIQIQHTVYMSSSVVYFYNMHHMHRKVRTENICKSFQYLCDHSTFIDLSPYWTKVNKYSFHWW